MKLVLVHTTLSWYRLPLFAELSRLLPGLEFVFTKPHIVPAFGSRGRGLRSDSRLPTGLVGRDRGPALYLPGSTSIVILSTLPLRLVRNRYGVVIWGDSIVSPECWLTFLLSKMTNSRFIIWTDEWGWPKSLPRRVLMPITNFVFRRADGVIVHGTKHARYFQHDLGIRKDKVFVSGNASSVPIPENWQATAEHLVETHHLRGKLVILYVGGLIKRKGVDLLMQAFARLHSRYGDTFLIIVGEGPEKDHLVDLSMKFGLESSVSFEGWVDHDNIAPYYAVAGLVVLPSALRVDKRNPYEPVGEPWGLVVNEAMMMAKPVITTNAAGCADDLVINGQNGFVVRQGDAHALLDALSEFIRNPESIRKMGESSRMMTHEFTYAHMARAFVKAVRQDYNEDRLQSN